MKQNPEITPFDRFRMVLGILLAIAGAVLLIISGLSGFASLPLTSAGILFVLSGVFIAGSNRLAQLITDMLS
jgi:hypothetical protein